MKKLNELNADERIQRIIIRLLRKAPLYADYLLRWPRLIVPRGTMAVDGKSLRYNPAFVAESSDDHLDYVLRHEVLHVILKHHLREVGYVHAEALKDDRMNVGEVRSMMNEAGDLEINSLLNSEANVAAMMPPTGLLPGRDPYTDHPKRACMEQHWDILRGKRKPPEPPPPKQPENEPGDDQGEDDAKGAGNDNGEGGGEGEGQDGAGGGADMTDEGFGGCGEFHPHPDVENVSDAQTESMKADQQFVAAVMGAQAQGKCPAWAKELADAITARPQLSWKVLLRRWARKSCRGGESSYARPSRRTAHRADIVLPSKRTMTMRRVLFVIDTSGSMSTDAVNSAVPEMLGIMGTWRRAELIMVQCDAAVGSETIYKPGAGYSALKSFARSPQWTGRGGTDMGPAFDLVKKYKPEAIICLTDGYLTWPDEKASHGIPTMWLMVTDQEPPWGDCIRMK